MTPERRSTNNWELYRALIQIFVLLLFATCSFAQETTAGLQGTVKDSSGAVVSNVQVTVTGTTLVGNKTVPTDSTGYYRFANLPPGSYTVTAKAPGFATVKREGLMLEVGHLPTLDLTLQVGGESTVVEVTGVAPLLDVTTTHTLSNITEDVVRDVPHGYSFQSVIQFSPGARNEPLAGSAVGRGASLGTGTGGDSPGSGGNGGAFGFSIGGGADSENSYLVEGQETADAIGGFSHTNVPFSFIQEVQVKSSGLEAEYGGALGGVVNVIMQKGTNHYHGSLFTQFEDSAWDGSPNGYSRYDPTFTQGVLGGGAVPQDPTPQYYQPKSDKLKDVFPGFTFGGPLLPKLKDKLWFFVSFNPEFRNRERFVNWSFPGGLGAAPAAGLLPFSNNQRTYYTNARIDAAVSQRIRLFGSWLYQYQRVNGEALPLADPTDPGLLNPTSTSPPFRFAHTLGYGAPNQTTNLGADISINPRLVASVRWGYNFQNYRDFGYPTGGAFYNFQASGQGATDNLGNAIPANSQLSQTNGFVSAANNINTTSYNATHHNQINASVAWFKSGWAGTHNFKFGYQLNRLSNSIKQNFNEPAVFVFPGSGQYYSPQGDVGNANCAIADPGYDPTTGTGGIYGGCAGQYGYFYIQDYGSLGQVTSMNHGFFVQDSWTVGRGLTINAGVRLEHETLPAEQQPQGGITTPIVFDWGSKIAPRLGAAWDIFNNGKVKVFGSYGKFYDIMKLNLAISSFGGQFWQNCYYALNTQAITSIVPVADPNNFGRYCVGPNSSSQANFGSAGTPPGIIFLENQNFRTFPTTCSTCTLTEEGVAPSLKPYTQHETVFGFDFQLSRTLFFETRWDRRRLDHAIEDSAIFNPAIGETFVIVNPGQGVDRTFAGFYNFLYPNNPTTCVADGNCPPNNIPAQRSYDGVEFRLMKASSRHWAGMFSYTYSHFRGNYTGLTNTDIADGGGGRNAPNNSRAFDEPFFSYQSNGLPSSGPLPTDRPNVFKGYAYYELPWLRKFSTTIGIFQYAYQGSPVGSFMDVGFSFAPDNNVGSPSAEGGAFPTYIVGRGNWLPVTQDQNTGAVTVGTPYARRTPWFTQSDLQLSQNFRVGEAKSLGFQITVPNALNQRAVVAYWSNIDSDFYPQYGRPGGHSIAAGVPFYLAAESPYNVGQLLNSIGGVHGTTRTVTVDSLYGQPLYYQLSRNIYMTVKFVF
jgi:Carboxypeptidase regulatory-like domain